MGWWRHFIDFKELWNSKGRNVLCGKCCSRDSEEELPAGSVDGAQVKGTWERGDALLGKGNVPSNVGHLEDVHLGDWIVLLSGKEL